MAVKQVVLIEDDSDVRKVLRLLLESAGWRVAEAGDAKSGLALIEEVGPDIVVTDLRLPGMSGLGVAAEVASDHRIPVVAITSDRSGLRSRAVESADFVSVLMKPLDPHDFLTALDESLSTR